MLSEVRKASFKFSLSKNGWFGPRYSALGSRPKYFVPCDKNQLWKHVCSSTGPFSELCMFAFQDTLARPGFFFTDSAYRFFSFFSRTQFHAVWQYWRKQHFLHDAFFSRGGGDFLSWLVITPRLFEPLASRTIHSISLAILFVACISTFKPFYSRRICNLFLYLRKGFWKNKVVLLQATFIIYPPHLDRTSSKRSSLP